MPAAEDQQVIDSRLAVPTNRSANELATAFDCCRSARFGTIPSRPPFHPLAGREFELLGYAHTWGEHRAFYREAESGRARSLPVADSCWSVLWGVDRVVAAVHTDPSCGGPALDASATRLLLMPVLGVDANSRRMCSSCQVEPAYFPFVCAVLRRSCTYSFE